VPEQTLYQKLAQEIGAGDSKFIPDIFETLVDEDEAKLLLAAAPPATIPEIAEKSGLAEEKIEGMIDPLFKKGLIFKSKKPEGIRYYRVRSVPQMHDATAVMIDPPKKMLDLWKQWMAEEWPEKIKVLEEALPNAVIRVIPVNITMEPDTQIYAFDDVKNLVQEARNLAVTPCSCRVIDGACGAPVEVCLQFNKAADYAIERGTGRQLTKEETIEMLKMCEEEGLVHVGSNARSIGHVICNCCSDCCLNWPSIRGGLGKFVHPSRFAAEVDPEICSSCEICLDRCFFEAISMEGEGDTAIVDAEKCMGCGLCLVTCPDEAIGLKEVRPQDFVPPAH